MKVCLFETTTFFFPFPDNILFDSDKDYLIFIDTKLLSTKTSEIYREIIGSVKEIFASLRLTVELLI